GDVERMRREAGGDGLAELARGGDLPDAVGNAVQIRSAAEVARERVERLALFGALEQRRERSLRQEEHRSDGVPGRARELDAALHGLVEGRVVANDLALRVVAAVDRRAHAGALVAAPAELVDVGRGLVVGDQDAGRDQTVERILRALAEDDVVE